jgi:hypothetical protein
VLSCLHSPQKDPGKKIVLTRKPSYFAALTSFVSGKEKLFLLSDEGSENIIIPINTGTSKSTCVLITKRQCGLETTAVLVREGWGEGGRFLSRGSDNFQNIFLHISSATAQVQLGKWPPLTTPIP